MVAGGPAWLLGGACVAAWGHVWLPGGHAWLMGACMVDRWHAWLPRGVCMVVWGGPCVGYNEI